MANKIIGFATLLVLLLGCGKGNNNSSGYIKANVDDTLNNFAFSNHSPGYSTTGYSVAYFEDNSNSNSFTLQLTNRDKLSSVPYVFTNDYSGVGIQMYYRVPNTNDHFANNWSQSTSNSGFKVTITDITNGMMRGTFQGYFRWYNPQSQPPGAYTQKHITNGEFYLPYSE